MKSAIELEYSYSFTYSCSVAHNESYACVVQWTAASCHAVISIMYMNMYMNTVKLQIQAPGFC